MSFTLRKPFFEETARVMIDERPEMTLAAIDVSKAQDLVKRYDISHYPTFLFFKNGKMKFKVNVGHSAEKFIEFCKNPVFLELPKEKGQIVRGLNLPADTEVSRFSLRFFSKG